MASEYPPSTSAHSSLSSSTVDMISALRLGPQTANNERRWSEASVQPDLPPFQQSDSSNSFVSLDSSYSPPPSATASSFEKPLLSSSSQQGRASTMTSSIDSYAFGSQSSLISARRGSAPSDASRGRPQPLDSVSLACRSATEAIPSGSRIAHRQDYGQSMSSPASPTLGGARFPPRKGSVPNVGTLLRSPPSVMPPYLARSTIQMNPFAAIRRRIFGSRSCKSLEEHQLIIELLASLEEYQTAFEQLLAASRSDTGFQHQSPHPNDIRLPSTVDRSELTSITQEMDNIVGEIVDAYPDFQQALSRGGYGPFSLPQTQVAGPRSSTERFAAYEPDVQELLYGQAWFQRLRRDLSDTTTLLESDGSSIGSPITAFSSPMINNSPRSQMAFDDMPGSPAMSRTDSQRSIELLRQGQRRWETYAKSKQEATQ